MTIIAKGFIDRLLKKSQEPCHVHINVRGGVIQNVFTTKPVILHVTDFDAEEGRDNLDALDIQWKNLVKEYNKSVFSPLKYYLNEITLEI